MECPFAAAAAVVVVFLLEHSAASLKNKEMHISRLKRGHDLRYSSGSSCFV